ncbi:hypothetical protein ACS5NO_05215 [Larkinella sp. GY13]|uniref:hypothetical protein n=1 Tax=Larkinella sp. GY13 TaxID=3453720 RepID=UPI003EEA58E3
MKLFTQSCLLVASFILLFISCTVQDHLQPSSVYQNCRLSVVSRNNAAKLLPGEDIKVGDLHYAATIYDAGKPFIVREITVEDGKTYAIGGSPYDLIYEYDANGKVLKTEDNTPSDKYTTYYEYLPNQINTRETAFKRSNDILTTHTLNNQGLVTNTSFEYGAFVASTPTYDENGYVVERKNSSGESIKYTIKNGNTIKKEFAGASTVYEYDLSRPNLPNPLPFFGKENRNLLVKESTSTETSHIEYKYLFDNDGRVKRMITKVISGGESFVQGFTDYEYSCQ